MVANKGVDTISTKPQWEGDVLSRKPTADFLYKVLIRRFEGYHSQPGSGSLTVALDGDWRAGKTFFVSKWSEDIRRLEHPVILFDAWANDLSDTPLLAFMSQLERDLKPFLKQLPILATGKNAIANKAAKVWKAAPKAIIPITGVVVKGLIKTYAGTDGDDLLSIARGGAEAAVEPLGKVFKDALKAHTDKQEAVRNLRQAIEDLLSYLSDHKLISLPMFIFVDELDRCRPDYAIGLLEGIKHLFDAQGLCFVFSTNLEQLAASTQAIYGPAFDGANYLKRFFSAQYHLPDPSGRAYATKLLTQSKIFDDKELIRSLPNVNPVDRSELLADEFAIVCQFLNSSLREQEQIFRVAEAAAAGITCHQVYPLYLFFLSAMFCVGMKAFRSAAPGLKIGPSVFKDRAVPTVSSSSFRDGKHTKEDFGIDIILNIYHRAGSSSWDQLDGYYRNSDTENYPASLARQIYQELQGKAFSKTDRPSVADYYELVRTAGNLTVRGPTNL